MRFVATILLLCASASAQGLPAMGSTWKGGGGGGTPSFVQGTSSVSGSPTSNIAFGSNVVSGHALFVYVFSPDGPGNTITFSDSQGNSWSTVLSSSLSLDGDTTALGCALAGSSAADTVSAHSSGPGTTFFYSIMEVSNAICTTDGTNQANNTVASTTCNPGTITTTTNNDFVIATCGTASSSETFTAPIGYSNLQQMKGSPANLAATSTLIATTAGSQSGSTTYVPISTENAAMIVAFKP